MEVTTIAARKRPELGKRKIGGVREAGHVPAVVYGRGQDPQHVKLAETDVTRELRRRHRVFELDIEGQRQPVYLQALQSDSLTDRPLHLDFMRIDMDAPMPTDVQLVFVGIPVGQSKGGSLMRDLSRLKIKSLPAAIPIEIEVKVGALDIGGAILAKDLALPDGVTLDMPGEKSICHVSE